MPGSTPALPTGNEFIEFVLGDVVPADWFDAIQEVLGSLGRLDLTQVNGTTIRALAGPADAQSGMGVGGAMRFVTSNVDQSMPGGSEAGRYTIYVTSGPTLMAGSEDTTNYGWNLAIVKQGGAAPSTAYHKVVGYLDWSGTAITKVVQTFGRRDDATVHAVAPLGSVVALEAIMPSAATANPFQASVGGVNVFTVGPDGSLAASGVASVASLAAGRNDRLALSLTGAAAGLTIGGDTQLYRGGAGILASGGSLVLGGYVQANSGAFISGDLAMGPPGGGGPFDVGLERVSAGTLKISGTATVTGSLALSSTTGAITIGGDANLYRGTLTYEQLTGEVLHLVEHTALKTDVDIIIGRALEVGGNFYHKGSAFGLFGSENVNGQSRGWGTPEPSPALKKLIAGTSNLDEVINVVLTLIRELQRYGLLGA